MYTVQAAEQISSKTEPLTPNEAFLNLYKELLKTHHADAVIEEIRNASNETSISRSLIYQWQKGKKIVEPKKAILCKWLKSKGLDEAKFSAEFAALCPHREIESLSLPNSDNADKGAWQLLETLASNWGEKFQPALIDSSYLQSAGRALKSEAKSLTDVQNLLRLVIEICSRPNIYIVLATHGEVYPKSAPIVELVNKAADRKVIEIVKGEDISYGVIVGSVLPELREKLPDWFTLLKQRVEHGDNISLSGTVDEVHRFLLSRDIVNQIPLDDKGAQQLAAHILSHPSVINAARIHVKAFKPKWTKEHTERLCSAVRADCYGTLAKMKGFSYQPSLSRYQVVPHIGPRHPLATIVSPDNLVTNNVGREGLSDAFLNSLIINSQSDPKKLVALAAQYGKGLKGLVNHLQKSQNSFPELNTANQQLFKLRDTFNQLVQKGGLPFLSREFSATPFAAISSYVDVLTAPYITARNNDDFNSNKPWKLFLKNCGIR